MKKILVILFFLSINAASTHGEAPGSGTGAIPPGEAGAKAFLERSPRHHEWVDIVVPGKDAKLSAFIAYPERKAKAPLVIVIHEVYGLSDWVRAVADQLAGDGFIAIAPDMLSGKGPGAAEPRALPAVTTS
jgi:carboxymethylenebutenolidase